MTRTTASSKPLAGAACWIAVMAVLSGCAQQEPVEAGEIVDEASGWLADVRVMDPLTYDSGPQRPEREPVIAFDPTHPSRLIAITTEEVLEPQYASWLRIFTSDDGGALWTERREVAEAEGRTMVGDPTVVFDEKGIAYIAYLSRAGLTVERSHDGGHTWEMTASIAPRGQNPETGRCESPDKQLLGIDSATGTLLMVWTRFSSECDELPVGSPVSTVYDLVAGDLTMNIMMSSSQDGGVSWTEPSVVWDGQGIGAVPLVGPDGQIHVAFWGSHPVEEGGPCTSEYAAIVTGAKSPRGAIVVRSSDDGGATWRTHSEALCQYEFSKAVAAETGATDFAGYGFIAPAATVDPQENRVHVSFMTSMPGSPLSQVWVMSSDTGAASWSASQLLGAQDQESFLPTLAADGGRVHAMYGQVTTEGRYAMFYRESGGGPWSEPVQLSSSDYALTGDNIGDYNWMDARDGRVAAIWTGTADGEMRVWARVGWLS